MPTLRKYPFLSVGPGVDWRNVNHDLLNSLNSLGRAKGKVITLTSGFRTEGHPGDGPNAGPGGTETQWYLWENAAKLGLVRGKTVAEPGRSNHQHGEAVDAEIDGVSLGNVYDNATLAKYGIKTLSGDAPHTELLATPDGRSPAPTPTTSPAPAATPSAPPDLSVAPPTAAAPPVGPPAVGVPPPGDAGFHELHP